VKDLRAIAAVWLWELGCAWVLAAPVHAWAKSVFGQHPYGDQSLFEPRGLALLEWLDAGGPALGIVLRVTLVLFVVFGLMSQVVSGAVIGRLVTRSGLIDSVRTGLAAFFPLLAAAILFGALQAFFLGIGFFASSALDHALQASRGDERAFLARLIVFGVFCIFAGIVGVAGDLAKVAVGREIAENGARPFRDGMLTGLRTARATIGRATIAWGWRAAIIGLLVVAGGMANDVVGTKAGGALWLLFGFHQILIVARAALRTGWLERALAFTADL
jgi:hypothetical protein